MKTRYPHPTPFSAKPLSLQPVCICHQNLAQRFGTPQAFGGTSKETDIRFAFQKLLDEYAKAKDLLLIPKVSIRLKNGKTVTPNSTLKDALQLDHGE